MKKKEILKIIVASSAIAGGIGLSGSVVQADEIHNNLNTDVKNKDASEVSLHATGKVVNVNSNLRVRVDAGDDYDTIGYVCNGQEIKILSEKGDWYRISFQDKEGYVAKKYISIENNSNNQIDSASKSVDNKANENTQKTSQDTKKGKVINVNSELNIRQMPNENSESLGTLKNGDTFEILSKTGDWYNIKNQNIVGFISSKYVQEINGNETTIDDIIQTMTETHEEVKAARQVTAGPGVVVNVASNLRVRNAASPSSETIGYLLNGSNVSIIGEESGWYKINFNGRTGYVSKDYIKRGSAAQHTANLIAVPEQAASGIGTVVNVNSRLNIRSAAGTESSIVGHLGNGETVNIIGKQGNWYHIDHNGTKGYVSSEYLQEGSQANNSTSNNVDNSANSRTGSKGTVVNVSSTLNIRSGAGTGNSIVGSLRNGETVSILGKENGWYRINHNGVTGYVSAEYLREGSSGNSNSGSSSNTTTNASGTGTVVGVSSTLNIRSGAGTGHSVVGHLRNGETVNITGKENGWYRINHNGVTGYVSAEYLKEGSSGGNNSGSTNAGSSSNTTTNVSGKGTVVNVSTSLNVRLGAGTEHAVVGSLLNGQVVNIVRKEGSWYHIEHNGIRGYVLESFLQEGAQELRPNLDISNTVSTGKGQVYNITSNLRVRSAASTNSTVLGYLLNGEIVDITGTSGGWVKINYRGSTGYVSADYIRNVSGNSSNTGSSTNASQKFTQVYNAMAAHIGSPYVWGGSGEYLTTATLNSLKATFPVQAANGIYNRAANYVNKGYRAFDCSGLMQWGFRQVGINIGRTTYDQINNGYEVSLSSLKPGDLLFYSNLGHVGMYIGNGQWIESPNSGANIRVTSVPWSKISRARRVL